MAGELYTSEFRAGVETTYGTAVTPTWRLYFRPGSGANPGGTNRRQQFLTGARDNTLSATSAPREPGGPWSMLVSSSEILEMLTIGLNGTPVITTPATATNARLHTYTPGTLKSATVQLHDGARPWQIAGTYANTLRFAGSANGDNVLSGDFFGASLTQTALTGTPTARAPGFFSGWETALFLDPVSGTDNYGTTLIAAGQSIINWDVTISNNLGRKYTAQNLNQMQAAIAGLLEVTGSVTFEASGAQALTEFGNFQNATTRRMRLQFGNNTVIEAALKSFVNLDISLAWTEMTLLGEDAGTRTYEARFGYVKDASNGFGVRVQAQNMRLAAFA